VPFLEVRDPFPLLRVQGTGCVQAAHDLQSPFEMIGATVGSIPTKVRNAT